MAEGGRQRMALLTADQGTEQTQSPLVSLSEVWCDMLVLCSMAVSASGTATSTARAQASTSLSSYWPRAGRDVTRRQSVVGQGNVRRGRTRVEFI